MDNAREEQLVDIGNETGGNEGEVGRGDPKGEVEGVVTGDTVTEESGELKRLSIMPCPSVSSLSSSSTRSASHSRAS